MAKRIKTREYDNSMQRDKRGNPIRNGRERYNSSQDWRAERDRVNEMESRTNLRARPVQLIPRTHNQEQLMELLNDSSKTVVVAHGPAGTGKTMLASHWAVDQLRAGAVRKLVVTRPNVAVDDRDLGFLPGDILEKMAPWIAPILDYLLEFYTKSQIKNMMDAGVIDVVPIAFMRGRTFKHSIVLVDEAQGLTANAFKSVLTRVGEHSRIILTGDCEQSDIGRQNGLTDFIERYDGNPHMAMLAFGMDDVQRHAAVGAALRMYR